MSPKPLVLLTALLATGCGSSSSSTPVTASDANVDSIVVDVSPTLDAGSSIPTEGSSLLPWLQSKAYASWPAESKVHASSGPHGGNVRTFVTRELESSLASASPEHPRHVAAVKELYGSGTTEITGWAVAVKVEPSSAKGDGWYWYEIMGTTSATKPVADGKGVPLCKNCHAAGKDYVLTPYPLQ